MCRRRPPTIFEEIVAQVSYFDVTWVKRTARTPCGPGPRQNGFVAGVGGATRASTSSKTEPLHEPTRPSEPRPFVPLRRGRRTALILPLFPPPQKNRS